MSETLPAQTETDSSITFIAAKPATARHFSSHLACGALVGFGALRRERVGVIADVLDGGDDPRGVDLVVAPVDGEPALGEIEPRVDDAGQPGQPTLDLADAAGAGDAFDRERHVRGAGIAAFDEHRQIEGFGHRLATHRSMIRFLERNCRSPPLRDFDDEVPLAGGDRGAAAGNGRVHSR